MSKLPGQADATHQSSHDHPTAEQRRAELKALTVLRAALNVFLTHGFSAATTDMIQREAGVSKSTVYAHYANKALFTAVIEAECAAFTNTVHGIEFRPGKLRETLTMLAKAYLDIVLSLAGWPYSASSSPKGSVSLGWHGRSTWPARRS